MIDVKNVSMKFNLGIEKGFSIKQAFINGLSLKKKKKGYFWALKDVSFHIDKGEVVGLIGSNGAGKSTLLKVVSGVMKPTEGEVVVNGVISPMIELGAGFDSELTARENIYLNGAILGYSKEFLDSKFDEIVEFSELKDFLDVPVKNFSSGMTAKLAFSIATVVNPEILIVDEILSVGDIKFQEKSKKKMMELIKGGTTVLYVSHSIESIKELCTKVVWLEHGQIVTIGDPAEVCAEYYYHMLDSALDADKIVKVNNITIDKNVINYDYEVSDSLLPLFNIDNKLKLEYSDDISSVPYEVAVIPFITGILPMVYLENIKLYVDKIDKDFYRAFDNIRVGYQKMLPNGKWRGKIIAKEIVDHSDNSQESKKSVFYSGGVGSNFSVVKHDNEKCDFLLIWGSDILQTNESSWNTAKNLANDMAKNYDDNAIKLISSNFRFYINENALTTKYRSLLPVSWWYDVQHGAGLLGHVAPVAYINKYSVHYIPSSYSIKDENVVCASYPTLDEKMEFCGCKVIHDGFEFDRMGKVFEIVDYAKKNNKKILLRVCCTERDDELNCCECEKCYRTICEIYASKGVPKDFGFDVEGKQLKRIKDFLLSSSLQGTAIRHWQDIQNMMKNDEKYFKNSDLAWLLDFDFSRIKKINFKKEVWNENGEKINSEE